jgi:SAM-dependent methyltransferase
MPDAAQLAQAHWNETPLFLTEEERYSIYPWLYDAAEFRRHAGEKVLEIGCGTGSDLLQFAKHGALATGVDLTAKHVELARLRVGDLAVVQQADARHLPLADESFDFTIAMSQSKWRRRCFVSFVPAVGSMCMSTLCGRTSRCWVFSGTAANGNGRLKTVRRQFISTSIPAGS